MAHTACQSHGAHPTSTLPSLVIEARERATEAAEANSGNTTRQYAAIVAKQVARAYGFTGPCTKNMTDIKRLMGEFRQMRKATGATKERPPPHKITTIDHFINIVVFGWLGSPPSQTGRREV